MSEALAIAFYLLGGLLMHVALNELREGPHAGWLDRLVTAVACVTWPALVFAGVFYGSCKTIGQLVLRIWRAVLGSRVGDA